MAKKDKMSDAELRKLVKAEEDKAREESAKKAEEQGTRKDEEPVSFDVWFAGRQKDIPQHHKKEVIAADFKARKLEGTKSRKDWDKALGVYGVRV